MDATAAAFTPGQFRYGFSPIAPSYEPESMQTRAADDLFDDDFTPVDYTFASHAIQFTPSTDSMPSAAAQHAARVSTPIVAAAGAADTRNSSVIQEPSTSTSNVETSTVSPDAEATAAVPTAPTGPKRAKDESRVHAVRGDRSATGGNQKPRLTEEELAAKMSELKVKNETREAAFKLAQEDAALFAQREEHAATIPKEDRKNRQQMMGEREKNRQRKLKAQGGREWDLEKNEDDFNGRNDRRGAPRGAHGGVVSDRKTDSGSTGSVHALAGADYDGAHEYMYREPQDTRGRGRGGSGRGRGGRGHATSSRSQGPPQDFNTASFPDLPKSSTTEPASSTKPPTITFPNVKTLHESPSKDVAPLPDGDTVTAASPTPIEPTKSWAELMEK